MLYSRYGYIRVFRTCVSKLDSCVGLFYVYTGLFWYALRVSAGWHERFNAGQLALLLNVRSFARAVASPHSGRVPLEFARKLAVFAVDFAPRERRTKVEEDLVAKAGARCCNALQYTASHCNTLQQAATPATHCNTLQHTATHCNTHAARKSKGTWLHKHVHIPKSRCAARFEI